MDSLNITDEELVKGIKLCLSNTKSLLNGAIHLIGKLSDDSISLGLYSYAVEEFGKALRLNDYRKRKKSRYNVSGKIFKSHVYKINRAKMELPEECTVSRAGKRIRVPNSETRTINLGVSNAMISVPAMTTGTFIDTIHGNVSINFKLRTDVFFVNWDANTQIWQQKPRLIKMEMEETISKFHESIRKIEELL